MPCKLPLADVPPSTEPIFQMPPLEGKRPLQISTLHKINFVQNKMHQEMLLHLIKLFEQQKYLLSN